MLISRAAHTGAISDAAIRQQSESRWLEGVIAAVVAVVAGAAAIFGAVGFADAICGQATLAPIPTPFLFTVVVLFTLGLVSTLGRTQMLGSLWQEIPFLSGPVLRSGGLFLIILVILQAGRFDITLASLLILAVIPCRIAVCTLPRIILKRVGQLAPSRVLIVGSGQISELVAASLLRYDSEKTVLAGFVNDRKPVSDWTSVLGIPSYDVAQLDRLLSELSIDHVVFAFSRMPDSSLVRFMRQCLDRPGVAVSLVPRFYEAMSSRARLVDVHGLPQLAVPGRHRRVDEICKAVCDRTLAAIGLIIAAPILLGAAIAIRIESPGPIFFRQERVGRHSQLFKMYKLRTMRELVPGEDIDGASRYTGVGAVLRKCSIDELPQLLNVLRGEMSLVGPRPERPELVKFFGERIPNYHLRHQVRGGITGLSQVRGLRGATSIVERSRLDNFYVEDWSIWFDLKIIFLTLTSLVPLSQGIGGKLMLMDLASEVAMEHSEPDLAQPDERLLERPIDGAF